MPAPRPIHWGILSTGFIAKEFARGLNDLPATEIVAVGSRSKTAADAFGDQFGIPRRHGSYEALASDPDVDVIYIGTPHSFHKETALLCLEAGKAVLCEKPFAINVSEAKEMVACARQNKLFLMEAMWTHFLPHMRKVRDLLAEGVVGEVRLLQADFGFRADFSPEGRLFNLKLGGGALLDVGIYPVALAHMLFNEPIEIKSFGNIGSTGVDEEVALLFRHQQGQLAVLTVTIRLNTPHEALVIGTEGRIHIHPSWWRPTRLTLYKNGHAPKVIEVESPLPGYNYEALEVNHCLRTGLLESEIMPLSETLAIAKTLDTLRAQWGLTYPME